MSTDYANCAASQQLSLLSSGNVKPIIGSKTLRPNGSLIFSSWLLLLPGAFDLQGTHFCFLFPPVDFHSLTSLSTPSDLALVCPSVLPTSAQDEEGGVHVFPVESLLNMRKKLRLYIFGFSWILVSQVKHTLLSKGPTI